MVRTGLWRAEDTGRVARAIRHRRYPDGWFLEVTVTRGSLTSQWFLCVFDDPNLPVTEVKRLYASRVRNDPWARAHFEARSRPVQDAPAPAPRVPERRREPTGDGWKYLKGYGRARWVQNISWVSDRGHVIPGTNGSRLGAW